MGKKKYKVGGLHWLLDYPEVIGVPTARNYSEFDLPAIAPSFLELDPSEIVIRTWNRKKRTALFPMIKSSECLPAITQSHPIYMYKTALLGTRMACGDCCHPTPMSMTFSRAEKQTILPRTTSSPTTMECESSIEIVRASILGFSYALKRAWITPATTPALPNC